MRPPVIISSHAGKIATMVVAGVSLVVVAWDASRVGVASGLRDTPLAGLFVWLVWLVWGLASITVDDAGVRVVNQFRVWELPWHTVHEVTGRWGLTVVAERAGSKQHRVRAWAAPARSTPGRIAHPSAPLPLVVAGSPVPVRVSLDAATAARLIEIEKEERLDAQVAPDPSTNTSAAPDPVVVRPNWVTITVTVILLAAVLLV